MWDERDPGILWNQEFAESRNQRIRKDLTCTNQEKEFKR